MATVTARLLSGSTNGRGISVTSTTAGSGTIFHTSVTGAGANTFDEVYAYAVNLTTVAKLLTVNSGGTTSGDKIRAIIPARNMGPVLMVPGLRYNGGVIVRGYATAASKVAVHGYVNRSA